MVDVLKIARTTQKGLLVLLVGALAVWALSGAALSLVPRELAEGRNTAVADFAPDLEARNYASPGGIIAQMNGVSELRLKRFLGRVVWEARGDREAALFDARTAERLTPLDEASARATAEKAFAGSEAIADLALLPASSGPDSQIWRATFKDRLRTQLFVSASTGEVLQRRNRLSSAYGALQALYAPRGDGGVGGLPLSLAFAAAAAVLLGVNRLTLRFARRQSAARSRETAN